MRSSRVVDEIWPSCGWYLTEWWMRCRRVVWASGGKVLGSIPASSATVKSEGRQMNQWWIKFWYTRTYKSPKGPKSPPPFNSDIVHYVPYGTAITAIPYFFFLQGELQHVTLCTVYNTGIVLLLVMISHNPIPVPVGLRSFPEREQTKLTSSGSATLI
jgi:hypothetical protein